MNSNRSGISAISEWATAIGSGRLVSPVNTSDRLAAIQLPDPIRVIERTGSNVEVTPVQSAAGPPRAADEQSGRHAALDASAFYQTDRISKPCLPCLNR
jgi:hypothetical protein